jgi:hypothetical protein
MIPDLNFTKLREDAKRYVPVAVPQVDSRFKLYKA